MQLFYKQKNLAKRQDIKELTKKQSTQKPHLFIPKGEALIFHVILFLYTSALPLLFGFAQVKAIGSSLLKCAVLSRLWP